MRRCPSEEPESWRKYGMPSTRGDLVAQTLPIQLVPGDRWKTLLVDAKTVRFRYSLANNVFGVTATVISLACIGTAVDFGVGNHSHGGRYVFGVVLFAIGATCSAWIAVGQFRATCIVSGDCVLVRNTFRSTKLHSQDVVGVAVRPVRLGYGPYFTVRLQRSGSTHEVRVDSLEYLPREKAEDFASEIVGALPHHPRLVLHT
jgi:hypothetical protein